MSCLQYRNTKIDKMKTTRFTLLILAVALLGSCKKGGVFCYKENGDIVKETREVTNFTEIALATQGNVYVTQGSEYRVEVESSQNIIDIIKTDVKGSTLVIDKKKGKCISGDPTLNFYITAPNINALDISGSGTIYADGLINTNSMDLKISGSGDIELDSLECSDLDMKISGSGSMEIDGVGTMSTQDVAISGSGSINAYNAPVNDSDVKISGSGSAYIHVLQTLDVEISGSGSVIYMGNPTVSSDISGSGSVRPY